MVAIYDAIIDAPLAHRDPAPHRAGHPGRAACGPSPSSSPTPRSSSTSSVIVKLFRRIHEGPEPRRRSGGRPARPRLRARTGPARRARRARRPRARCSTWPWPRAFLAGATDGWHLALTSLRILFAGHETPDAERRRLRSRRRAARRHHRRAPSRRWPMPSAPSDADLAEWVAEFRSQLDRVREHVPADAISRRYDRIGGARRHRAGPPHPRRPPPRADAAGRRRLVPDRLRGRAGPPARRTDPPVVAPARRGRHVALVPLRRPGGALARGRRRTIESQAEAAAWEERARDAYLDRYFGTHGIDALLPPEPDRPSRSSRRSSSTRPTTRWPTRSAYRPSWVPIPLGAIERLLS